MVGRCLESPIGDQDVGLARPRWALDWQRGVVELLHSIDRRLHDIGVFRNQWRTARTSADPRVPYCEQGLDCRVLPATVQYGLSHAAYGFAQHIVVVGSAWDEIEPIRGCSSFRTELDTDFKGFRIEAQDFTPIHTLRRMLGNRYDRQPCRPIV